MRYVLTTLLILGSLLLNKKAEAQVYSGPESVEFDSTTSCYYISNTTSHKIVKRNPNGTTQVFATLTGTGPHGLEIVAGKLFACNGATVKVFDLNSAVQLANISLTGAAFLNGITHIENGSVFVTDFNAKKIYRINPNTYGFNVMVANTSQTPNGIIYDFVNNRLVYGTWGAPAKINAVSLTDSVQTTLVTTTISNIDGICMDSLSNFYVTNWGSNSLVMYPAGTFAPAVTLLTGLSNPADICYNFRGDTIGIPNSGNNTVVFYYSLITGLKEPALSPAVKVMVGSASFSLSQTTRIFCTNASGMCIQEETLAPGQHTWPQKPMPSGMYLLRLRSGDLEEKTLRVYLP